MNFIFFVLGEVSVLSVKMVYMKKIICFHLYNDYSGSPKVLSMIIRGLASKGYQIELYTSRTNGFLTGIDGVIYHTFDYKWTKNKLITILRLFYAQLYMFISCMKYKREENILFYVNTICPVGAVLSAAFCRIPVVYHVHEKYINPNLLHIFYEKVWKRYSTRTIFVSKYLQGQYNKENMQSAVVYNALSEEFLNHVRVKNCLRRPYNILMICSLKKYKGVDVFIELAKKLPQYDFSLVLNSSQFEIDSFFSKKSSNLKIYPTQQTVHQFLYQADLLLNLSVPTLWIETFGLTLLEAMSYGLPVICPPVGGPIELVENDKNGFCVDSGNIDELIKKIIYIFESGQYERLSENAKTKSLLFDYENMINGIEKQIKQV